MMSFIPDRNYTSQITNFIQQLKKERPYLEAEQQKGRQLLWDKEINLQQKEEFDAAKVKQKAYVYQTKDLA